MTNECSQSPPIDIAIVGGGLGGVMLAIGLIRHKMKVRLYEAAPGFGEIGAGVACGPSSVNAMELIDPRIFEAFKLHATFNRSPELASTYLEFWSVKDIYKHGEDKDDAGWPIAFRSDAPLKDGTQVRSCVHRANFLDEIIKLVPDGTASFNKSLTNLEDMPVSEGGGLRLQFADGTTVTVSAVIGCDGIRSTTRNYLYGDKVKPKFTGEYAYRALVPANEFEQAMGPRLTYNAQLWMGDGGYIISYPVDHGRSINTVAVACHPGSEWPHEKWVAPVNTHDFEVEFRDWPEALLKVISKHSFKNMWALHDLRHDQPYFRGCVCLLGDSCHASTAHLGAGAGQAMEDAYILSNLLANVARVEDVERAFRAYDVVRRPRSQRVVADSRQSGLMLAGRHPAVTKKETFEREESILFRHTWEEDLEHTLQDAKQHMAGYTL